MDILSHAIAGACTGAAFGRPGLGAAIAVLPDIPLVGKRRDKPPVIYVVLHSLPFVVVASLVGSLWGFGVLCFFCLLSHIILDLPTHGKRWAPTLLWPWKRKLIYWEEWEFFNKPWMWGLLLTVLWSNLWIQFW